MTTATVIVNDALKLLNLNSGILPVKPRNQDTAFRVLVDMLKAGLGDNVRLLRQMPASIAADLHEPHWATKGLKEMLAREAAPYLQAEVPANLGAGGERILRNNARQPIACSLPDSLPVGSGNQQFVLGGLHYFGGPSELIFDAHSTVNLGESATYFADFDLDASNRTTTVSSVAWSVVSGVSVSISSQSLSSNLASAVLAFGNDGSAVVRARATYANGQIKDFNFNIGVAS